MNKRQRGDAYPMCALCTPRSCNTEFPIMPSEHACYHINRCTARASLSACWELYSCHGNAHSESWKSTKEEWANILPNDWMFVCHQSMVRCERTIRSVLCDYAGPPSTDQLQKLIPSLVKIRPCVVKIFRTDTDRGENNTRIVKAWMRWLLLLWS